MGRGYWLPPRAEQLEACDGFYIDSRAVYTKDIEQSWSDLLERLCKKLLLKEKTLRRYCAWKSCEAGQSRFVILQNRYVDIVAEDADDYVAVYVLIPEDCENPGLAKRSFSRYLNLLRETLVELYPGSIRKRINSQHTKAVG